MKSSKNRLSGNRRRELLDCGRRSATLCGYAAFHAYGCGVHDECDKDEQERTGTERRDLNGIQAVQELRQRSLGRLLVRIVLLGRAGFGVGMNRRRTQEREAYQIVASRNDWEQCDGRHG